MFSREYNVIELDNYKQRNLFIVGWVGLIIISFILSFFLSLFIKDDATLNIVTNFVGYALIVFILLYMLKDNLKTILLACASRFKHLSLVINVLIAIGAMLGFSYLYSFLLVTVGVNITDNNNQIAITGLVGNYPVLSFIFVVILAPLSEEITYRLGLFSLLRKKSRIGGYIISATIFALIHFDFSPLFNGGSIANECINIPTYFIPGIVLAYAYEKEGLTGSYLTHLSNNLISFIMIMVL